MDLAETVSRHARSQPKTIALLEEDRGITYQELDRLIRQGAAHLRSLGVGSGDPVALCLRDKADHVIAFLSVARLGAVSVPIDWRAPPTERSRITRDLGVKLTLVEAGAPKVADLPSIAVDPSWYAQANRHKAAQEFLSGVDAPLMIGLTSGTTGAAKGVLVTHRQMHARTIPFDAILTPGPHRYLSASPLAFSACRNYWLTHLIKRHTVIFHPSLFTAAECVEAINRYRATEGFVVPTVIRWLLDLPRGRGPLLPGVETLMCGGAPLHAEEKRAMLAPVTPNFDEFYGKVATGPISFLRPSEMAVYAESAGRPAPGWNLAIVDENDRPVGPDDTAAARPRPSARLGAGRRFHRQHRGISGRLVLYGGPRGPGYRRLPLSPGPRHRCHSARRQQCASR